MPLESSIDIHVPELEALIKPWYSETVEVARLGVPPHLTILWPWKNAPVSPSNLEKLGNVLKTIEPFTLTIDRLETFPNGTIYLAIKNRDEVQGIMRVVAKAFPDCPPYRGEFDNPTPHITVAKPKCGQENVQLVGEINKALNSSLPLTIEIKELVVMQQKEDLHWKVRETLRLGNSSNLTC